MTESNVIKVDKNDIYFLLIGIRSQIPRYLNISGALKHEGGYVTKIERENYKENIIYKQSIDETLKTLKRLLDHFEGINKKHKSKYQDKS